MEYNPLVFSRFETRFLRLVEHDIEELGHLLRFDIGICALSDPPDYSALSYCWGDVTRRASVEISGKIVEISESLRSALQHSGLDVGDFIWADAICINQDDLHEKSYQVNMMGQIYAKAKKVIVWLGTESRCSSQAARFVRTLPNLSRAHLALFAGTRGGGDGDDANLPVKDVFLEELSNQSSPQNALHGVAEILSRPYWERVWIIQEISKASVVEIRCGGLQFELEALLYAGARHRQLTTRVKSLLAAISDFREQEVLRLGRMPLMQALLKTRFSLATNERDKVFALLGLAGDSTDLVPMPSYDQSIPDVFEQLTKRIMESRGLGNVLLLAKRAPLIHRFHTSSLWAVDWAELAIHVPEWLIDASMFTQNPTANPATLRHSVLTTHGCRLGHITSIAGEGSSWESHRSALHVMVKISQDLTVRLSPMDLAVATIDATELACALARMIEDADDSTASTNYNLGRVHHTLSQLKYLLLHGVEFQEWARRVNLGRGQEPQEEGKVLGCWKGVLQLLGCSNPSRTTSTNADESYQRRLIESAENAKQNCTLLPTLVAFRLWEDVLAGFNVLPEYDLKFAILSDEHLVIVTKGAVMYSHIYQLDHCSLPIVLDGASSEIVGEVYVGRQENGRWFTQVDPSLFHSMPTDLSDGELTKLDLRESGRARANRMDLLGSLDDADSIW